MDFSDLLLSEANKKRNGYSLGILWLGYKTMNIAEGGLVNKE